MWWEDGMNEKQELALTFTETDSWALRFCFAVFSAFVLKNFSKGGVKNSKANCSSKKSLEIFPDWYFCYFALLSFKFSQDEKHFRLSILKLYRFITSAQIQFQMDPSSWVGDCSMPCFWPGSPEVCVLGISQCVRRHGRPLSSLILSSRRCEDWNVHFLPFSFWTLVTYAAPWMVSWPIMPNITLKDLLPDTRDYNYLRSYSRTSMPWPTIQVLLPVVPCYSDRESMSLEPL